MQQQANFTWPDTEIVAEQLSSFLALCSSLWCTTHKTKPEKPASLYSLTLQDLWVLGALGEEDTSGFKSESNRSRTQSCQSSSLWTFGFALGVDCHWRRSSFYCSLRDSEAWKMEPGLEPRDDRGKRTPERNTREVKCTKLWVFYFPQRKGDLCL